MGCSVDVDLCDDQDDNGTLTVPEEGTRGVHGVLCMQPIVVLAHR